MNKAVCDFSSRKLFNPTDTRTWVAFIGSVFAVYVTLYSVASLFNWEKDNKLISEHYYHVLYTILLASFIYQLGNFNNTFTTWFVLGMFIGGLGIAAIGQLPGFQFSIGSIGNLTGLPLFTVIFFAALAAIGVYMTFQYYRKCNMTSLFLILFLGPILILALGYLLSRIDSDKVEFRLHHWQWALLFVFFARFPGVPWQSFLTGVFVGIIIDGISRYGPDTLFTPIE